MVVFLRDGITLRKNVQHSSSLILRKGLAQNILHRIEHAEKIKPQRLLSQPESCSDSPSANDSTSADFTGCVRNVE